MVYDDVAVLINNKELYSVFKSNMNFLHYVFKRADL